MLIVTSIGILVVIIKIALVVGYLMSKKKDEDYNPRDYSGF